LIPFLLLAAALPGLYLDQPADAVAEGVRKAGADCVYVPAARAEEWRKTGLCVKESDPATYEKVPAPTVQYRMNVASATSAPWVTTNAWRYARKIGKPVRYEAAMGQAALSLVEAFAYGVDAVVRVEPGDLPAFGVVLAFLKTIPPASLPVMANIGFLDDGSFQSGEYMNLMSRRNLLYRVVGAPDPKLDLNVKPGSGEFPKTANPGEFAAAVRGKLTDAKRLVRVYGSDVVIARLTGDGKRARLHLINYSGRGVESLRVRVRGPWKKVELRAFPAGNTPAADVSAEPGVIEFSIQSLPLYAVADLE
jgi:hypothetical protein